MNGQILEEKQDQLKQSLLQKDKSQNFYQDKSELQKTTLPLMFAVGVSNVLYTNLHSFYPLYIQDNFPQLKATEFGIILATFEIANLVTSLFLGVYIGSFKRKNLIIYSLFVLLAGTLAFVTLTNLQTDDYLLFFWLSILFRVIQGASSSAIQICAYSFATNEMSDDKDRYIGYVEIATGLGDMVGPALGGFVFQSSGFVGTFLAFSAIVFVGAIISIIKIPAMLNKKSTSINLLSNVEETSSINENNDDKSEGSVISDTYPQVLICLLSACFAVIFTLYIDCILALHLHSMYGVQHNLLGIFFLLASITYVIGAPLGSYLSTRMHRRYVVFLAFGCMIIQNTLQGPSYILGLPDSLILVVIGVSMIGFCLSLALVPLLSELIETLEDMDIYEPSQICDMTASIFNSMFNLGNLVAPLIAGVLNDNYGYKFTTDFMLVSTVIYCIIFYFTMIYKQDLKIHSD
ncbi:permeases of the major facilitator superfamily [Stylonychia lemnae]|uniref:Permeases of the major facilitator superfamily n=1 Tax=Stylonychia lemnae TaxID=5949 RepID=A0A078AUE1_STYLE|nr:permeases of the major facilitator superfamily [Stylonychia lemnae]|eukprot:CDW85626.1 permeases of the major facilitator superfamily [Stylonychia lemnae]